MFLKSKLLVSHLMILYLRNFHLCITNIHTKEKKIILRDILRDLCDEYIDIIHLYIHHTN